MTHNVTALVLAEHGASSAIAGVIRSTLSPLKRVKLQGCTFIPAVEPVSGQLSSQTPARVTSVTTLPAVE